MPPYLEDSLPDHVEKFVRRWPNYVREVAELNAGLPNDRKIKLRPARTCIEEVLLELIVTMEMGKP